MDIHRLLTAAVSGGASDVHLSAGLVPLLRIDGDLQPLDAPPLAQAPLEALLRGIMDTAQREEFQHRQQVDFSFEIAGLARCRVNVFRHHRGCAAVLRLLASAIPTLEDLHAPSVLRDIAELPRGLVLVTGPTGSGKSTTLAAMIDHLNRSKPCHLLTVEDPIEFVHASRRALVHQREVRRDVPGFDAALRAALREDPDAILVGEMRDLETIRLALTAAETGHLVFGTLHTASAAKTVDRIVDVFPAAEKAMVRTMLAESLRAVVSQALVKKIGGGRVAAHEILIATPAIRHLIREGKVAQMYSALQSGAAHGMQTLDQSLLALCAQGQVAVQEARSKAADRDAFRG